MIGKGEYVGRMGRLQEQVGDNDLYAFLVTAEESIYYLTGVTYVPLERPFFILVRPGEPAVLLVPALEQEHLRAAPNIKGSKRPASGGPFPASGTREPIHAICLQQISDLDV